jgi:hypothetical protein
MGCHELTLKTKSHTGVGSPYPGQGGRTEVPLPLDVVARYSPKPFNLCCFPLALPARCSAGPGTLNLFLVVTHHPLTFPPPSPSHSLPPSSTVFLPSPSVRPSPGTRRESRHTRTWRQEARFTRPARPVSPPALLHSQAPVFAPARPIRAPVFVEPLKVDNTRNNTSNASLPWRIRLTESMADLLSLSCSC